MANTEIWNALKTTDPKFTKAVSFGQKFTSINAQWQLQRMTEQFGPIGKGWGYSVEHDIQRVTDDITVSVADVTIWWMDKDSKSDISVERYTYGPVRGMAPLFEKNRLDDDSGKKAMTDALTKGLSHLGLSADVFLGQYDDNKYVQALKNGTVQVPGTTAPSEFADEAVRDGLAKDTTSTYQVEKDKKLALLRDSALLAIGTSESRPQLSVWWSENRDTLKKKLGDDDYVTVYDAVLAKRDELPELAA